MGNRDRGFLDTRTVGIVWFIHNQSYPSRRIFDGFPVAARQKSETGSRNSITPISQPVFHPWNFHVNPDEASLSGTIDAICPHARILALEPSIIRLDREVEI